MSKIKLEIDDRVGVITLDDPDRRNVIDLEMTAALVAAVEEVEANEAIGAVVVTGAGKAFCAGASLGAIEAGDQEVFARFYDAFLCVARCGLPTVAAVNGAAVGAGMNLALACDVRIAAERARFISRFFELGLHPGGSHTWMLDRIVGPQRAAAMVLFNEELRGQEAVEAGLALRCVAGERLLAEAVEMAGRAAAAPRELALRVKSTLAAVGAIDAREEAVAIELEAQLWSSTRPFYSERVAAMRQRIGR